MPLRFLQLGDLHLGASLTQLAPDTADALRSAVREVTRAAFAAAGREAVDLVLMPGDLFETEGVDPAAQLRFVYEQADAIAPTPVVIAPGNHDAYSSDSPYAAVSVPANVSLFTDSDLLTLGTPAGPVTGRAVQAGESSGALRWSTAAVATTDDPSVLILHASVLSYSDGRRHRNTVVPTALATLAESGHSYTALGHYHRFQEWTREESGLAVAAYAGCPQGLGWDEPGEKGYLLGELTSDGAKLEFVPAARHLWHRHQLQLPPEHAPNADAILISTLQNIYNEVGPEDLLELAARGRWPDERRAELEAQLSQVLDQAWHARALDLSGVDFYPPLVEAGESELIDGFIERCEAELAAADGDEAETQAWQLARYLGQRLLSGQGLPEEVA